MKFLEAVGSRGSKEHRRLRHARWPLAVGFFVVGSPAIAHGLSESSKKAMADGSFTDFVGLGAEHMVTGLDHLLFLLGVVFFLTGLSI